MKKVFYLIIASLLFLSNCKDMPDMSDPYDSVAPGSVSNTVVEDINGGAIITYSLPGDNDILGVKCEYSFTEDGKVLEMFSSAHRDTINLEGFPDTNERTVKLIVIDKSFNESEPVEVKIKPLTPPIDLIRESLTTNPAFGGVYANWKNEFEKTIQVNLLVKDSLGFWTGWETLYSVDKDGSFAFRGFEAVERDFRIVMRDHWDNYAEPLDFTITPLFEEEIIPWYPDDPLKENPLWDIAYGAFDGTRKYRGDFLVEGAGWEDMYTAPRMAWGCIIDGSHLYHWSDGSTAWSQIRKPQLAHWFPEADELTTFFEPTYFIFDLNEEIYASRFVCYPMWIADCFPNEIEVWGTTTIPKGPEDFDYDLTESLNYWTEYNFPPYVEGYDGWKDDWTKLGYVQVRPTPSGAFAQADWTSEDEDRARRGYEIEVYPELVGKPVRYLRFVCRDIIDTGEGYINEIKIYGEYVDGNPGPN